MSNRSLIETKVEGGVPARGMVKYYVKLDFQNADAGRFEEKRFRTSLKI